MPGPDFPPARGVRMQWTDVDPAVRSAVEGRLGSSVVDARSQSGGFSPGVAARVKLADGRGVFVKAACSVPNPDSPTMHRREAAISAALPADAPAPALQFAYDDGEWIVLVFDDVDGQVPELPWQPHELTRVLLALYDLATALTPAPIVTDRAADRLAPQLRGWRELASEADLAAALPVAMRDRLDALVALETEWPAASAGETLVHLDVRADNVLLTPDRVYVVDWPAAAVGAPWLDLVAMLPSIAMQGGPAPEDVWQAHPLARGVDAERVDAFLAGVTGFFVWQSLLPPPPGLPTLRAFQSGQAAPAWEWLASRRGWS